MILAQKADHAVPLPVAALLARGFFCFTTGTGTGTGTGAATGTATATGTGEGTGTGKGIGAGEGEGKVVNSAITILRSSSLRFFMREIIA
jgi:hypothetical protein